MLEDEVVVVVAADVVDGVVLLCDHTILSTKVSSSLLGCKLNAFLPRCSTAGGGRRSRSSTTALGPCGPADVKLAS